MMGLFWANVIFMNDTLSKFSMYIIFPSLIIIGMYRSFNWKTKMAEYNNMMEKWAESQKEYERLWERYGKDIERYRTKLVEYSEKVNEYKKIVEQQEDEETEKQREKRKEEELSYQGRLKQYENMKDDVLKTREFSGIAFVSARDVERLI